MKWAPSADFSCSLYLGLRHSSAELPGWAALTTGVPAALREPPGARRVARELAALVGCGAATLGVSTMHLLCDWFGTTAATRRTDILWDEGIYAVGRWGVERAAARGARARRFAHHDPASAARALADSVRAGRRPIVVTDGHCVGCGRPAPLAAYHELARDAGGLLVVDDTQALGVTGDETAGGGGGGSLRRAGLDGTGVVWVASLAKAFGAPLAALAGEAGVVERFEAESQTRLHASPPSAAAIASATRALEVNRRFGRVLRQRLSSRIRRFGRRMAGARFAVTGGAHPVQLVDLGAGLDPVAVCRWLGAAGVRALPVRRCGGRGTAVAFVITAAHQDHEIDQAAAALEAASRQRRGTAQAGFQGGTSCSSGPI